MTITDGKESFIIDNKDVTNKKDGYIIGIDENEYFTKKMTPFHSFDDVITPV